MNFLGLFNPLENDSDDIASPPGSGLDSSGSVLDSSGSTLGSSGELHYSSGPDSSSGGELDQMPDQLPPEPQLGNIEYKLKLVSPSKHRFQHLVTQRMFSDALASLLTKRRPLFTVIEHQYRDHPQSDTMKWRLREGHGEAIYEIGVEDCGAMRGLSLHEMTASMTTLHRMAAELGAAVRLLRQRTLDAGSPDERCVAEVLIRKVPDDRHSVDLRLAVLGNADVGKSTLSGVLTQGQLDNGRGRSRLNMLRHLHEIQTGRTSSISHEILGFDSEGNTVDYSATPTAEEICEQSSKLVTFIDLAGHQKYLKTTVGGLTGYSPHYAMLVVSAVSGLAGTTREHLGLALALKMQLFVVITKIDLTSAARLRQTLETLEKVLRSSSCGQRPLRVVDESGAVAAGAAHQDGAAVVPIFSVSSVTGAGLPLLKKYLHTLSPSPGATERQRLEQQLCEFQIDETFRISETGTVVGGLLLKGIITEGATLSLGPLEDGSFTPVRVSTIHRNRRACRVVRAGQAAALAIDRDVPGLRRGMVLLAPQADSTACLYFQATVCAMFRSQALYPRFQTTVHLGSVRQTAVVEGVCAPGGRLLPDQRASVLFRFLRQPEHVRVGDRLLFRQDRARGFGIGTVTQVFPCRPAESRA